MDRRLGRALPSLGARRGNQTPDRVRISAETALLGHWVVAVTPGCHVGLEVQGSVSPQAATWQQKLEPPLPGRNDACTGQTRGQLGAPTPDRNAPPASGELQGRHLPGRPFPVPDPVLWRIHSFRHSFQCACVLRVSLPGAGAGLGGIWGRHVAASLFPQHLDLWQDQAPCGGFSSTRKVF